MTAPSRLERTLVGALALFAFVNALSWAMVTPMGNAPDETGHFEVVAFESVFGRIPEFGVDDCGTTARTAVVDGYRTPVNTYSAQPGLSYLVSAAVLRFGGGWLEEPARAARFPGAIWAALLTGFVYLGVRAMFPGQQGIAVLAATITTFWPQLAFVFSYINNDGLTTTVCALLVGSWFIGANNGWGMRDAALLGVASGLVLLNKPNGFPLVGIGGLVFVLGLKGTWRERSQTAVVAGAAGLATCGWWYLTAYRRYGWDLLATARAERLREALGVEWASGRFYGKNLLQTAIDPFPRFGETWIAGTLRTAVGAFGEITIPLATWSYATIACTTAAALIGFVLSIYKNKGWRSSLSWLHTVAVLVIPLMFLLSAYRSWAHDFQAQGRYLFPAVLPFAAFLSVGLLQPFKGRCRAVAGSAVTLVFLAVFLDSFAVRLLGAYRMSFGDLWNLYPVLMSLWVGTLVSALAPMILFWMRMATADDASAMGPRMGFSASE